MFATKSLKLKIPVVIAVLGVLTLGFFCTGMITHVSMHAPMASMNATAVMSSDSQQECCNTTISKNIESWKSTLLVLPREVKDGPLLFLLALIITAFVGSKFRNDPDDSHRLSRGLYIRDNPELTLFNQLRLAFSNGILNPKIY